MTSNMSVKFNIFRAMKNFRKFSRGRTPPSGMRRWNSVISIETPWGTRHNIIIRERIEMGVLKLMEPEPEPPQFHPKCHFHHYLSGFVVVVNSFDKSIQSLKKEKKRVENWHVLAPCDHNFFSCHSTPALQVSGFHPSQLRTCHDRNPLTLAPGFSQKHSIITRKENPVKCFDVAPFSSSSTDFFCHDDDDDDNNGDDRCHFLKLSSSFTAHWKCLGTGVPKGLTSILFNGCVTPLTRTR